MKTRSLKIILALFVLVLFPLAGLSAWDEGYITLTVPVKSEAPLAIEPDLGLSLLDIIPPGRAAFRLADGVVLFNAVKIAVAYQTNRQELSAELSGWLPVGPFRLGAAVEGIWADDPVVPGSRYWSAAATLFGSGWIVKDVLNLALDVQYDFFFQRLNAGLGVSVAVIPDTLSLVAEGLISPLGVFSWAWRGGVLVKTAGHQFLFSVGNGNDMRMRNILAAVPDPGAVAFGIAVRRKVDIFF